MAKILSEVNLRKACWNGDYPPITSAFTSPPLLIFYPGGVGVGHFHMNRCFYVHDMDKGHSVLVSQHTEHAHVEVVHWCLLADLKMKEAEQ